MPKLKLCSGLLVTFVTAEVTKGCGSVGDCYEKWQLVFAIAASVHIFNIVFYSIFASGEVQDWATESQEQDQILGKNTAVMGNRMEGFGEDDMVGPGTEASSGYGTADTKQ